MRIAKFVAAGGLLFSLSACSSTAISSSRTTTVRSAGSRTFPATSATVSGIVAAALTRITAAEGSDSPNVYENAGASARSAGNQLNSLTYPSGVRAQSTQLIAALRDTSVDSAMAAGPTANLETLTQTFESNASRIRTVSTALAQDLP